MGYTGIITLIFVILIVAYLVSRAARSRKTSSFEDDYFGPTTGREAPMSAKRWRGKGQDWGQRIDSADARLHNIKAQVDEVPASTLKPDKDLSDLPPDRRKIEAQRYLNQRRGKNVRIVTDAAMFKGQVATVTASKVLLREPGSSDVAVISLEDVLGIS